ncbi:MAG: FMN-dependent NADH-azoreductase [Mycoplasmataceae bacterium]|nr:MAG: FMN-dependent NADH-azoreductase [Mycoplasmataceae bacterium]
MGMLSDEFIKKVAEAMKKAGDNDGIEKIADLQKNREENIEDWIKRLKGASREEKRRIMDEISDTTRAELEAANKILAVIFNVLYNCLRQFIKKWFCGQNDS